jgi:TDG/mug DNA glycosylase family protein
MTPRQKSDAAASAKAEAQRANAGPSPPWSHLRLRDRIKPGVRVLFVGINPGIRSALTGHHFAGYSNRFWKLLSEAGLAPEPTTHLDDDRLPEWGFGVTNLIARPSPGIGDLKPHEYVEGWRALERKIRRYRPEVVALVGVTLYRVILPLIQQNTSARLDGRRADVLGAQPQFIHGAQVYVLPNPSGRNAHFSHGELLEAFIGLRRHLADPRRRSAPR